MVKKLMYLFSYKTSFFPFQNNPKNLDLSSKMDVDLLDCFGKVKLVIIAKFQRTDLVICSHSGEGKTPSYSGINMITPSQSPPLPPTHTYIHTHSVPSS